MTLSSQLPEGLILWPSDSDVLLVVVFHPTQGRQGAIGESEQKGNVHVEQETRDVETDHLLPVRWTLGQKETWQTFSTFLRPEVSLHLNWLKPSCSI